jgi:hypothetical protein
MGKYEWVKIQDRKNFVSDIKVYHPNDPRYIPYWKSEKKKVIEGVWVYDNNGWRYMPPKLYFTVNHGSMIITDSETKYRKMSRPYLTTLFWEMGYMSLESLGFSGFKDSNITCNPLVLDLNKNWSNVKSNKHINLFKSNGTFKDYVPARDFMRQLHDSDLGLPLYENVMSNYMLMGTRSGGKSYYMALGELTHEIITDGARYYTEDSIKNPNTISVLVGSGDTGKSAELCAKVQDCFTQLGESELLGVYGKIGDDDYTPSPFFKDMVGDISANNKDNPFRHSYKVRVNGRELLKGTDSKLLHVSYSEMKANKKGAQAGAGSRVNVSIIEEIGLTPLVREAWRSNESIVQTDGIIFGRQIGIGTSENIEAVAPAKEIMTNPEDYRILKYDDIYEHTGKIGFFIPSDVILAEAMDEHGNIDFDEANLLLKKTEEEKSKANNPDILRSWRLNYPRKPSDMWLGTKAKLLPYEESALREKELMTNNLYHKCGKNIRLVWDSNSAYGVKYEIVYDAKPVFTYPITSTTDVKGSVVVYDFPQYVNGQIPEDMYIYTHDPYIADDMDKGGSLGCTQVWLNPKYFSEYMIGSPLVAVYLGKHPGGKKQYYEIQEKLISMYGNCPQMLYYEANRGEDCYYHYLAKGKVNLLCPRPTSSDSMFQETTRKFGFMMSNRLDKLNHIASLHDLLLSKVTVDKMNNIDKTFISTIPDIYLVREIMAYNLDDNFDAISATLGYVIAIRELEKFKKNEIIDKNVQRNKLAFLSVNPNMFAHSMDMKNKYY